MAKNTSTKPQADDIGEDDEEDEDEEGEYDHPIFDKKLGPYSWCLHCETVYKTESWIKNGNKCPDCGAGATDLWRWEEIREINPNYPETPEEGITYPPYGKDDAQAD